MLPEIGQFLLILAFALSLVQIGAAFFCVSKNNIDAFHTLRHAALAQSACCIIAFTILIYAFAVSDFSVVSVADNSHTHNPLIFRITAAWGHHEGSLLLWIVIQTLYSAIVSRARTTAQSPAMCAYIITTLAVLNLLFLALLLFTSNPFLRIFPVPLQGLGFNPLLQDFAISYHPPTLYIGYIGFAVPFAYSIAALVKGEADRAWADSVRQWVLFSWIMLTIGITAGAFWAYYELGWGGWWFWDPVENASLLPWLVGTALLHSVAIMAKRGDLQLWTIALCIIAFGLSLFGTFLVRSGVLTSVHTFANDPKRGLFVLGILTFMIGGGFTLFAVRAPKFAKPATFVLFSREGAILLNNLFLSALAFTILLGTLYPLILNAMGDAQITVGPPYYILTAIPIALLMIILMGIGPLLQWQKASTRLIIPNLSLVLLMLIALLLFLLQSHQKMSLLAFAGFGGGFWLIALSIAGLIERSQKKWNVLFRLSLKHWGMVIAHFGLGVAIIGMTGSVELKQIHTAVLARGQVLSFDDYTLVFDDLESYHSDNYAADRAIFSLQKNRIKLAEMKPEKRFYLPEKQTTTEVAFYRTGLSNLYLALGDAVPPDDQAWSVRLYVHPLINLIWGGSAIMVLGGILSLMDRRKKTA